MMSNHNVCFHKINAKHHLLDQEKESNRMLQNINEAYKHILVFLAFSEYFRITVRNSYVRRAVDLP